MRSMTAGGLAVISILWSGAVANAGVSGCAVVHKAPNGFVYLRKAPANSEVVTRLEQGDLLFVDTARCETEGSFSICDKGHPRQWTHITYQSNYFTPVTASGAVAAPSTQNSRSRYHQML